MMHSHILYRRSHAFRSILVCHVRKLIFNWNEKSLLLG